MLLNIGYENLVQKYESVVVFGGQILEKQRFIS